MKSFLLVSFLFLANAGFGQETFLDNFSSASYTNNDGTLNFAAGWVETNETTSPTAGVILVNSNQLRFKNLDARYITRSLDLSGATSATLSLDYNRTSGAETILVQLFDGVSYTTVATLAGTGTVNYNLTPAQISTASAIRFITGSGNWKNNDTIFVDNVLFTVIYPPMISIDDVSVNEDAGTATFTATHIRSAAAGAYTVDFATVDGTAIAGADYTASTGTLNFSGAVGETQQITIGILEDLDLEASETFSIQFTTSSDPTVDISDTATGTINDNEVNPNGPRPYEERYAMNLSGNFLMKGNTNLLCTANCPGTPTSNNPSVVMGYADVDTDGTTVNSSSSTFTLPAGATVTYAGLYWGGMYNSTNGGITNPAGTLNIDQVKIMEPGAATYTSVAAQVRNIETAAFSGWNSFMSHADVTGIVQTAGTGTYFVADIALATGSSLTGPYGGWTMVVVYEDPSEKSRNIALWDGFDFFGFGANDTFTVTGLLTPSTGTFETHSGYFGFDGEASSTGDFVSIEGTALTNGLNPNNNTLNGTISEFGVDVGARNPNFGYSWGIDIDIFDASGYVPNSATTANVVLGSSSEGIWGGVFVISNEIAFPAVASKVFTPAIIYAGDESTVTINIENPSSGVNLTNIAFIDNLPAGMIIAPVPGVSSSCGGTIVANPGGTSFDISGINMAAGTTCSFTFSVLMNTAGDYVNTISSSDVSNDQNIPLSGDTSSTITVLPFVDTDNDGVGDHADLDDDNDGITDCEESIDNVSSEFAWSVNTPSGTLDMDYVLDPKITDWAISSTGTMVLNSPIFSATGSNLRILSMTSANVEEAIANGDFVEVEFTTGPELSSFEINNLRSGWYLPSEGDSYYSSTYYSVGGSDAWSPLASDTFHTDDGSTYAIFDHMDTPSLSLTPNTLYQFRIYVHGQIDDSAQNYSVLDDINFAITACRSVNTDGDTFPDHLDTDSDGDGCLDVIEAGFTESGTKPGELQGTGYNTDGTVSGNIDGYTTPADTDTNAIFDFKEFATPFWVTAVASLDATVECAADAPVKALPACTDLVQTFFNEAQFAWGFGFQNSTASAVDHWQIRITNANYRIVPASLSNQTAFTYSEIDNGDGTFEHIFTGDVSIPAFGSLPGGNIEWLGVNFGFNPTSNGLSFFCGPNPLIRKPVASDGCGTVTVTELSDVTTPGSCANSYVRVLTYEATNAGGNTSALFTTTITIEDNTVPTASNPLPVAVFCTADIPAPDISVVTDEADNCTTSPTVTFISDVSDGGTDPEIITRTYSVTDECNNSINVTQAITVTPIGINDQPTNQTVFAGDSPTLTVTTSNADTYQWQVSTDGGTSFNDISDGANYTGTQTITLMVNSVDLDKNGYQYRGLVSNSGSLCAAVISNAAVLTVKIKTVITNRRITYRVKKN